VCVACRLQGQSNGLAAEWAEELSIDMMPLVADTLSMCELPVACTATA
jgi:hypothetical protein